MGGTIMNKTQLQFAFRKPSANRGSLGRRLSALAMSLLLVCSLPLAAFAEEYDLANGSITVTANDSGQYVTQEANNIKDVKQTTETVIKQTDSETSSTTNTVTINADAGATANVTLSGVNIKTSGAAVEIKGNGNVVIELDGSNTVQSGNCRAGVEKNTIAPTDNDPGSGNGNLTITDENGTDGSLNATCGWDGAGIGGGAGRSGSNITITGSAKVTATGGDSGAGIGGGYNGSGSYITIEGSAEVNAKGGNYGAGIGGGWNGSGSDITISGSAEVKATGGGSSAGIGGGHRGSGSNIKVSEDAQVKASGGNDGIWDNREYFGKGAAIGEGGKYMYGAEAAPGKDVAPNTDELKEGWIATYAPGTTNLDTATPKSLTYQNDSGTVQTATENITIEAAVSATSNTHGHEAGFKVDNTELVAVTTHNYGNYQSDDNATCTQDGTESAKCTVPGCTAKLEKTIPGTMKDHEFVNYVPDANNLATCTTDGTKTATCENCTATDTVTDPAKGHSFTNYVSNNDATYEKDGTKTARCDHPGCDATDTITDPGTRLPAPLYQLKGQDGMAVGGKTEQKDGVLTIEVDADFATLTGYLGGLQGLRAQGVDTIVFVTNGATSTFALADLMASMTAGDNYALTHDGETVTFTLATGTDISSILK